MEASPPRRPTIRHKSPPPQPPFSRQRQSSHSARLPELSPLISSRSRGKMALDVLHGIELEKRLCLIIGEGEAVRHTHIRADDEGRSASVRALVTKTVQPSEFGVAERTGWKAAVEVWANPIGLEKMTVGIEPLNYPPHLIGQREAVLAAGGGMGQAEMYMTLQAETAQVIEQEVESEIQPIDGEARLGSMAP